MEEEYDKLHRKLGENKEYFKELDKELKNKLAV